MVWSHHRSKRHRGLPGLYANVPTSQVPILQLYREDTVRAPIRRSGGPAGIPLSTARTRHSLPATRVGAYLESNLTNDRLVLNCFISKSGHSRCQDITLSV